MPVAEPPPFPPRVAGPRLPRAPLVVLALLLALLLAGRGLVELAVDALWFGSLGYEQLFTRPLFLRLGLWSGTLLAALLFLGWNLRYALRERPFDPRRLALLAPELALSPAAWTRLAQLLLFLLVLLPALRLAGSASGHWLEVLLYRGVPFGEQDPVFGRDIAFYVFRLPVLEAGHGLLRGLLLAALLEVGGLYAFRDLLGGGRLSARARRHLLLLAALYALALAAGWWLQRFDLLFERSGAVWGVGYADEHARLPAYTVLLLASGAGALLLAAAAFRRGWGLAGAAVGLYALARVLAWAWPAVLQDYVVAPNELELERPYLARSIQATRRAYALDRVAVEPFDPEQELRWEDVERNPLTIDNIRIWDERPLLTTYAQLQEIRTYYAFHDVDADRYRVSGRLQQVALSARELDAAHLPAQARSWVNAHLQYTHGYGLTMSPVNRVTEEGMPELLIRDLPPSTPLDLRLSRPEIYYGERTDNYVIVGTSAEEFDYPQGDTNAYTHYQGRGGVPLGGFWREALFALHLGSLDILLSRYLGPDSRVLLRRRIDQRVRTLAPFLRFDGDPYPVLADGRIRWIIDAYTVSTRYPYAEPVRLRDERTIDYVRNAVKVVVDAYDGTVDFYVADPSDPLVRALSGAFPGVFRPLEQMPASLQEHLRYPRDFFDIQVALYRTYHMTDPTVFYNREDLWDVPQEIYSGSPQVMEPYYLIMRLPGEPAEEFILLLPFVPRQRDNMIAWLAARCDPEHYGQLVLYQFSKQKLVYGPSQIEARIDQDPEISAQMTLWSQAGSRVVRGNLLVIPVAHSLLYVEPIYLQAESGQLPELKRVIVAHGNRLAMRPTLEEALRAVFLGERAGSAPARGEEAPTPEAALAGDWRSLAREAEARLEAARQAASEGDWAAYGEALAALERAVRALAERAGGGEVSGAGGAPAGTASEPAGAPAEAPAAP